MSAQARRGRQEGSLRHGFQRYNAGNMNTTATRALDSRQARSRESTTKYPRVYQRERHRLRKTRRHLLTYPSEARGVEVVYTNDVFEAESWLREHITVCSARVVGFDIEWRPQFISKRDGGTENQTAVLQLGVDTSCLVLHIYHMSELTSLLVSILRDENILKVGVGIEEDGKKLRRHRGLVCEGMTDIQTMVTLESGQKFGLKALAQLFLGIELEKSKRVAMSNWENFPLTLRQIEYAALDAWAGVKIYQAITERQMVERPFVQQRTTSSQYNGGLFDHDQAATSPQSPAVYFILLFTLLVLLFYVFPQR